MKLKNIVNRKDFFDKIAECHGSVELHTNNGDILNMKSTLCQYIALTQMFQEDNLIDCKLLLSDPDDMEILRPYLVFEKRNEASPG